MFVCVLNMPQFQDRGTHTKHQVTIKIQLDIIKPNIILCKAMK